MNPIAIGSLASQILNGSCKEAVTPPGKRFVFIGYFLSFGTDRTQDDINNNL